MQLNLDAHPPNLTTTFTLYSVGLGDGEVKRRMRRCGSLSRWLVRQESGALFAGSQWGGMKSCPIVQSELAMYARNATETMVVSEGKENVAISDLETLAIPVPLPNSHFRFRSFSASSPIDFHFHPTCSLQSRCFVGLAETGERFQ